MYIIYTNAFSPIYSIRIFPPPFFNIGKKSQVPLNKKNNDLFINLSNINFSPGKTFFYFSYKE